MPYFLKVSVRLITVALIAVASAAKSDVHIALSATSDPQNSGTFVWAETLSDELSKAGISTNIYANSSLGNEVVRSEQVLLGLLEINVSGTQEIEPYTDLMAAVQLPFLFESVQELDCLLDESNFLERVNEDTTNIGIRVVDFVYLSGMSGLFTANRAIRSVADMKSFRMRAMTTEQLDYFEAWGGAGTQVAWEEVPQALQTGIVDGYMNPPIVAVLFGHGGQLDYFTDIRMSPSMRAVVISEAWYQGLNELERHALHGALRSARRANRSWMHAAEQRDFALLDDAGIEVIQLSTSDRGEFRERLLPLYSTHATPEALHELQVYVKRLEGKCR